MKLKKNIHYVGVNDRTTNLFESTWSLPYGVSYNSYLIDDEKIALIDTVEVSFISEYIDKIKSIIGERPIDYLIINHMEPDHSGSIKLIRQYYPNIKLVGNKKTFDMVDGFYRALRNEDITVINGSTLNLGETTLQFYITPMIHWPETMVTYDTTNQVLFSGDAFGCFGALNGAILDKDLDTTLHLSEMERYYACILGKYGKTVQAALKKVGGLPIDMICSTHGPIWHQDKEKVIDLYHRLSCGEKQNGLVIAYGSMYGFTLQVAEAIAKGASESGVRIIKMYDVSRSDTSQLLADVFRYNGLALGAPTYNGDLFPAMKDFILKLVSRETSNHKLAIFGGFSWAGKAVNIIEKYNECMKMELVDEAIEWKQGASPEILLKAKQLGNKLAEEILQK